MTKMFSSLSFLLVKKMFRMVFFYGRTKLPSNLKKKKKCNIGLSRPQSESLKNVSPGRILNLYSQRAGSTIKKLVRMLTFRFVSNCQSKLFSFPFLGKISWKFSRFDVVQLVAESLVFYRQTTELDSDATPVLDITSFFVRSFFRLDYKLDKKQLHHLFFLL